jgi:hypothetical protein
MRVDAVVTQGRSLAWPASAALVSAALLLVLGLQTPPGTAAFVAVTTLLTALSLAALSRGVPQVTRAGRRRVGADVRGLSIDGELVLPRSTILRARVKDEPSGGHSVIVEARGLAPSQIVHVESARIAQGLVDTLEQPPHEVVVFDALPPWAHRMRWLAMILTTSPWIFVNLLRFTPPWAIGVVLGLYGVLAVPLMVPQKVAIGDDGIFLRWAGRRRFVPFGQLHEARSTPLGVELELEGARSLEIRLTHRTNEAGPRRAAMLARIEQGMAYHHAFEPGDDEALLARGGRDIDLWMSEMSQLGTAERSYRAIALPRERLWAIVENPGADPSARRGAALALRNRLDDDDRDRLLSVAQRSALPSVRVAFDAVARAEDTAPLRIVLEESEADDGLDEPRSTRGLQKIARG